MPADEDFGMTPSSVSTVIVGICPLTCKEATAQVRDEVDPTKRIVGVDCSTVAVSDAYERPSDDMS